MKTSFLLPVLLIYAVSVLAQTQSNVNTPRGTSITAYITPEDSQGLRLLFDSQYSTPSRTLKYYFPGEPSSSGQFNCHGYAWHMAEGGQPRWIGYYVTTDEDPYMTDGSYIQVCSEVFPGKVSWDGGDHSAITTPTPGRYRSKWNRWVYLEHAPNDTPFSYNSLKYYSSTSVQGSDYVGCSNATFSVGLGVNYSWTTGGPLQVIGSTNQNTLTVVSLSGASGWGWVEVTITSPCDNRTIKSRRDVFVGKASAQSMRRDGNLIQPYSLNNVCLYNQYNLNGIFIGGNLTSTWQIINNSSGASIVSSTPTSAVVSSGNTSGGFVVKLILTNGCGSSDFLYPFNASNCGYFRFTVYPNPAKDYINIDFEKGGDDKDYPEHIDLIEESIYGTGKPVRSADLRQEPVKQQLKDKHSFTFDVKDLPRGRYVLRVTKEKEKDKQIENIRIVLE